MNFFESLGLNNLGNSINNHFEAAWQHATATATAATATAPQSSNKPPPASTRAISNLPNVQVTSDDLIEETNKECAICLDDQQIGHIACKLPCGHLFHRLCVVSWLEKQCTCPTCRFELETSDTAYEAQRKLRMKERKQRIRIDELKAKKISELRELCRSLQVDISSCIYKQDIIDQLQASGKITITQGVPPMELTEDDFHSKSVSQLKHLLLSFGLSTEGALEKADLRNRLLASGRVLIVSTSTIMTQESTVSCTAIEHHPDRVSSTVTAVTNTTFTTSVCVEDASDEEEPPTHAAAPPSPQDAFARSSAIVEEVSDTSISETGGPVPVPHSNDHVRTTNHTAALHDHNHQQNSSKLTLSRSDLAQLPLRDLRAVMAVYELDVTQCLERGDLMRVIEQSPEIELID